MAIVDFTTYTESDPGADLTVTSSKIDGSNVDSYQSAIVYKDYGADYFNAIDFDYELYIGSGSGTNNSSGGLAVINSASPSTENSATLSTTDIYQFIYKYNSSYRMYLFRGTGTAFDSYDLLSSNTLYYLTLTRTADSDTVNCYIYSNSGRTTLVDTLTVAGYGTSTKWQYVYGFMNRYILEANANFTGYVQNLDLNVASSAIKTINGLVYASVKTVNGLAIASVKTKNGLA